MRTLKSEFKFVTPRLRQKQNIACPRRHGRLVVYGVRPMRVVPSLTARQFQLKLAPLDRRFRETSQIDYYAQVHQSACTTGGRRASRKTRSRSDCVLELTYFFLSDSAQLCNSKHLCCPSLSARALCSRPPTTTTTTTTRKTA